jgi:hypothetical protein
MTTKINLKLICDNLIFLGALSTLPIFRLSTILKYLFSLFKKWKTRLKWTTCTREAASIHVWPINNYFSRVHFVILTIPKNNFQIFKKITNNIISVSLFRCEISHCCEEKKIFCHKLTKFSKNIPKNIKNFQICIHGSSR